MIFLAYEKRVENKKRFYLIFLNLSLKNESTRRKIHPITQ